MTPCIPITRSLHRLLLSVLALLRSALSAKMTCAIICTSIVCNSAEARQTGKPIPIPPPVTRLVAESESARSHQQTEANKGAENQKPGVIRIAAPVQDPAVIGSQDSPNDENDPQSLLEMREQSATPHPLPDLTTPAERVVPIPITPPSDSFPGFVPESAGDWSLPEPRRVFPLPIPKQNGSSAETQMQDQWFPLTDSVVPNSSMMMENGMIFDQSFSGRFGSLLDSSRNVRPGALYIPSLMDSHVAQSNFVPEPDLTPSVTVQRPSIRDMRSRLQEKQWQFHLAKTLPFEASEAPASMSSLVCEVPYQANDFAINPFVPAPTNPCLDIETYYGKVPVDVQRPWVEWWRPFYTGGMYEPGVPVWSDVNLFTPSFLVYGDYRTGVGVHRNGGRHVRNWAHRLNLDMDLRLTGTERFHMFAGPLDHNGRFTRLDFSNSRVEFEEELDFQPDTAFFEGDLGAITGSWIGTDAPFDLPFTCGLIPLLYQNGIWMEDAIAGVALGAPWRHNNTLNWANFDATFFAGFNQVTSPAFQNDNNAAAVYGTAWFVEAYQGYIEMDYAYVDDLDELGRSYHNAAIAYTRRYFGRISNSIRLIGNIGQSGPVTSRTADGGLLIIENSLISSQPSTFVPYWNMFVGSGRPQSVARAANAGGILRNVGINFETDGLTGYPTLDATGSNSYGGAIGLNMLSADFRRQWMVEFASLDTYGDPQISAAVGPEYALGTRYQQAINNRCLWRIDFMNGLFDGASDIYGTRAEFRWKF